jgi:hypothetical protein
MKPQSALLPSKPEIAAGRVFVDLCERIESRSIALPIVRAGGTLDATNLVAAPRGGNLRRRRIAEELKEASR